MLAVIDVVDVVIQGKSKGTGSLGWTELLLLVLRGYLCRGAGNSALGTILEGRAVRRVAPVSWRSWHAGSAGRRYRADRRSGIVGISGAYDESGLQCE